MYQSPRRDGTRIDRGDAAYARRMEIAKPSDADRAFFRQLVPAAPGVEVKAMFGNLGAFVAPTTR